MSREAIHSVRNLERAWAFAGSTAIVRIQMSLPSIADRLADYRQNGRDAVGGWFLDECAEVIEQVLLRQVDWDVRGDVAEIGVHYGKSFLMLANGVRDDERAIALDVFGDQEKNVDGSGRGNREIFEGNVATWADGVTVQIVQASSLEVDPATAAATFGQVRMFSIDGGHTAAITAHDLRIAEAVVVPHGVVLLDDVLNEHWLGVITGLADYLAGTPTLVPFAVAANKLFMAPSEQVAERYRASLRQNLPDALGKKGVEFLGTTIDVYGPGSRRARAAAAASRRADAAAAKKAVRAERRIARLTRELAEAREVATLKGAAKLARRRAGNAVRRARTAVGSRRR